MEVFAIHEGCRFEGGGVTEIYSTEEKAIKFALMRLKEMNEDSERIHEESFQKERWNFEEIKKPLGENIVKMWHNAVDELIIYKYEVK